MENPELSKNQQWSELEKDPEFLRYFLHILQNEILDRKFGVGVAYDHRHLTNRRAKEKIMGNADKNPKGSEESIKIVNETMNNPLIPEIAEFENKIEQIETIEGTIKFAKNHGFEFTSEQLEKLKKETIEWMIFVRQSEEE